MMWCGVVTWFRLRLKYKIPFVQRSAGGVKPKVLDIMVFISWLGVGVGRMVDDER